MPAWEHVTNKLLCTGWTSAAPGDLIPPGKYRKLLNVAVRKAGGIVPRPGLRALATFSGSPVHPGGSLRIHSARRVSRHTTLFHSIVVVGAGSTCQVGTIGAVNGAWVSKFTGLTGNPLSIVFGRLAEAGGTTPYIFDVNKNRKLTTSSFVEREIGIAPPGKGGSANGGLTGTFPSDVSFSLAEAAAPTLALVGGTLTGTFTYKYRYRSDALGTKSNPSAEASDSPSTQGVNITVKTSPNVEADKIDIFRKSTNQPTFRLLRTEANSQASDTAGPFTDNATDVSIASADVIDTDRYQPWIITDAAGDTKANNRLSRVWGPFPGLDVMFGVGDTENPGRLYWTNPNDPDSTDTTNFLDVTGVNEPLVNGFIYGSKAFVWSSERLYAIYRSIPNLITFEVYPTHCGKGLYAPWAFAVGDYIYFLARDGIYRTDGGPEKSITGDIYNFFPHEGSINEPAAVEGIGVPRMRTDADDLRLNYFPGNLYFDYVSAAEETTLRYDFNVGGWFPYIYDRPVRAHITLEGEESDIVTTGPSRLADSQLLIGTDNGNVFTHAHGEQDEDGAGTNQAFACEVKTPFLDMGDPRTQRLYGDTKVEVDRDDLTISVTPQFDLGATAEGATSISTGSGRQFINIDHNAGNGQLARNIALDFSFSVNANKTTRVTELFAWHPSFVAKPDETIKRAVEWHEFTPGIGDAYVWGIEVWIDTENQAITFAVHKDGSASGVTFAATANGERKLRFTWVASVFHGRLGKLLPTTALPFRLTKWEWLKSDNAPLIPDIDTDWKAPLDECDVAYVTGVKIEADSENVLKTLIFQSELEGTITAAHTATNANTFTHNGRLTKTFVFTPFRAHQVRVLSTDGVGVRIHDICWLSQKEPSASANWEANWTDLGHPGLKYVQGLRITADTLNQSKTVQVGKDEEAVHTSLTVQHNKRTTKVYTFDPPFTTHLVRLLPTDTNPSWLYGADWIWEPAPDAAVIWETQESSYGLPGYHHVRDAYIPIESSAAVTWTRTVDGVAQAGITIASTSGSYLKRYVQLPAKKGKLTKDKFTSANAFRIYFKDVEVRAKPWGSSGAYQTIKPFGDEHFRAGARI